MLRRLLDPESRPAPLRLAATAALALAAAGLAPAPAAPPPPAAPVVAAPIVAPAETPTPTATALPVDDSVVDLADGEATAETRSLFAFLRSVRGQSVLFGHQHTTDYAVTDGSGGGVPSDIEGGVGALPAVFGWDTLGLSGVERPGTPGAPMSENAAAMAAGIRAAHDSGAINTLSAHLPNFVTGGGYDDVTGDVVRQILPGGPQNAAFVEYLDGVADVATGALDAQGRPIPIVFRPFHENNGGWFWWGAGHTTSADYKELFRYTVEYLRDTRDVHSLLYAYSPNGTFDGDPAVYLDTYPGDDFVDVLGYDLYDATGGSPEWFASLATDTGMVARLADEHGKVSALTEVGITGGLRPNGENLDPQWYTHLLAALRSTPDSARTAYALTWANFGSGAYYAPYPAFGDQPAHELLPDFQAFAADPATAFAGDLTGVFDRVTTGVPEEAAVHVVSPTDRARVAGTTVPVRVRATNATDVVASFTVDGGPAQPLALDADGYYSGSYTVPGGNAEAGTASVVVSVAEGAPGARGVRTERSLLLLGPVIVDPLGVVDSFESYSGDDTALNARYLTRSGPGEITLTTKNVHGGRFAMAYAYDFSDQVFSGVGHGVGEDWSGFSELTAWITPDGSGTSATLQLLVGGIAFEYGVPLTGTEPVFVRAPLSAFAPASWDTVNAGAVLDAERLRDVQEFSLFLGKPYAEVTRGVVYVDEIRAR